MDHRVDGSGSLYPEGCDRSMAARAESARNSRRCSHGVSSLSAMWDESGATAAGHRMVNHPAFISTNQQCDHLTYRSPRPLFLTLFTGFITAIIDRPILAREAPCSRVARPLLRPPIHGWAFIDNQVAPFSMSTGGSHLTFHSHFGRQSLHVKGAHAPFQRQFRLP